MKNKKLNCNIIKMNVLNKIIYYFRYKQIYVKRY